MSTGSTTKLQAALGHQFAQPELLMLALTHRSAATLHNQRLEFLGDAVLGFVIAEYLYQQYPDAPEGELSQVRARLVNRDTLAGLARQLAIGDHLVLGLGERKSGGRQRDSILCDAMEAVLGAVYLDGGLEASRSCILSLLADLASGFEGAGSGKDSKTQLQEMMQARGLALPSYQVVSITGQEHDQLFHVECAVALLTTRTSGRARTRRLAEQQAAQQALELLARQQ